MKGYSDEPQFYFGDQLRNHFRLLIEGAEKVKIASAWITKSDMLQLLVSQAQNGAGRIKIQILVGVGGYHTSPVVLKQLGSTAGIALKVYGDATKPPLFHPKLYLLQRQHWRRCLIGSMNFTGGGTVRNIESVYSFEDRPGIAEREFERFWDAADAKPFSDFDLKSYESERSRLLTAVKEVGATDVLEQEVVDIAGDPVQVDALLEGWKDYVSELKKAPSGERRANWRDVLNNRHRLVNRDWSQDLSDDELDLMFGTGRYKAFGNLKQAKVN